MINKMLTNSVRHLCPYRSKLFSMNKGLLGTSRVTFFFAKNKPEGAVPLKETIQMVKATKKRVSDLDLLMRITDCYRKK